MDYVRWKDNATEKVYICMKARLEYVLKQGKIKGHTIIEEFKGQTIVGKRYKPLFNFFESRAADGCF
jgi:isoleucyl-tRNA synthetase